MAEQNYAQYPASGLSTRLYINTDIPIVSVLLGAI